VTDIRLTLVHLWITTGDNTRALEEGARVLAEAIRLHDPERQARALAAMGAVYDRLGRYRDALESYRQALRFEERTLDRHRQALALGNLALVYLRMGLPGPAVVHAGQALSLARVLPDVRLQVSLKQAYAASLAGAGDFRQSERTYAEIAGLVSRLSSPELLGLVLAGRGRVLLALGRLDEAERHIREALDLALRNRDSLLHLQAKSGLALVDWQRGDLDAAVEHLEESRRLVEDSRGILSNENDRMSYGRRPPDLLEPRGILTEVDRRSPIRPFEIEPSGSGAIPRALSPRPARERGKSSPAEDVAPGPSLPSGLPPWSSVRTRSSCRSSSERGARRCGFCLRAGSRGGSSLRGPRSRGKWNRFSTPFAFPLAVPRIPSTGTGRARASSTRSCWRRPPPSSGGRRTSSSLLIRSSIDCPSKLC
jgi:tetratricopeptide (TPR) repeat protein